MNEIFTDVGNSVSLAFSETDPGVLTQVISVNEQILSIVIAKTIIFKDEKNDLASK